MFDWITRRRPFGALLLLAALLFLPPVPVLANGYAEHSDASIVAIHKIMNGDNTSVTTTTLSGKELKGTLSPPTSVSKDAFTRENTEINVWVTSSNMTETEKVIILLFRMLKTIAEIHGISIRSCGQTTQP